MVRYRLILILSVLACLFHFAFYVPIFAAPPPTIDYYKTNTYLIGDYYGTLEPVQAYSGGLAISEYTNDPSQAYPSGHPYEGFTFPMAGHIGEFNAPPYETSFTLSDYRNRFSTGLVIKKSNGESGYESSINPATATSIWYPSKIIVENEYSNTTSAAGLKNLKITSAKIALPAHKDTTTIRGFAIKLNLTNTGLTSHNTDLMWLSVIPNLFDRQVNPSSTFSTLIVDQEPDMLHNKPYLILTQTQSNQTPAYMLIGIKTSFSNNLSWSTAGMSVQSTRLLSVFNNTSVLPNLSYPALDDGLAVGLSLHLPTLLTNQSQSLTYFGFVGASRTEVENQWNSYQTVTDIETYIDAYWNARLSELFNRLPKVTTTDSNTEKLYYNAALSYFQVESELFGKKWINQSGARNSYWMDELFLWTMGTDMFWPMADPTSWKDQVKSMLSGEYDRCQTFSANGSQGCNYPYAYSTLSLARQVYEYTRLTRDTAFLNETVVNKTDTYKVIDLIEKWTNQYAASAAGQPLRVGAQPTPNPTLTAVGSQLLTDIKLDNPKNSDNYLYELNWRLYDPQPTTAQLTPTPTPPCHIFGASEWRSYWGKIAVANMDRYMSHTMLSELYASLGEYQKSKNHATLALNIKNKLMSTLWDNQAGWFKEREGYSNLFFFEPLYHALDFPGLLTSSQKQQMLTHLSKFSGPYGFYATWGGNNNGLSTSSCTRTDWQGPGLYSGAVGLLLQNLFQDYDKNQAFNYLLKYKRFGLIPIGNQQYPANVEKIPRNPLYGTLGATWYDEHTAFAQVYIRGLAGFEPILKPGYSYIKLRPRIPLALMSNSQSFELSDLYAHNARWGLKAADNAYAVTIHPNERISKFHFYLDPDVPSNITLTNIQNGNYDVIFDSITNPPDQIISTTNNNLIFSVTTAHHIYIRPSNLYPWTNDGPFYGWGTNLDTQPKHVYSCNGQYCWIYNDTTSTWENGGQPVNLVQVWGTRIVPAIDEGGNTLYPWSNFGATSAYSNPYRKWFTLCQNKWCWKFDENTQTWSAPADISLSWKVQAAADGTLPWSNGGPTSGWQNTTTQSVINCNGKYCWEYNDATSTWDNGGLPFDISLTAPYSTSKAATDGTRMWSNGGPTVAWSNPEHKWQTICNGSWCWTLKECDNTFFISSNPGKLSENPSWQTVKPASSSTQPPVNPYDLDEDSDLDFLDLHLHLSRIPPLTLFTFNTILSQLNL